MPSHGLIDCAAVDDSKQREKCNLLHKGVIGVLIGFTRTLSRVIYTGYVSLPQPINAVVDRRYIR